MKTFRLKTWYFAFAIIFFTILICAAGNNQIKEPSNDTCGSSEKLEVIKSLSDLPPTSISFVLFTQEECDLCRTMESNLCRMISNTGQNANTDFYKIDADSCTDICIRYNISGIPTILILNNGVEEKRIMGIVSVSNLRMIYERMMRE